MCEDARNLEAAIKKLELEAEGRIIKSFNAAIKNVIENPHISAKAEQEISLLKKDIKIVSGWGRWIKGGVMTMIFTAVSIGIWVGTIRQDVVHNKEMIASRTEDRFYRQDGDILKVRIENLEKIQGIFTETMDTRLSTIESKLDRLIESK